MRLNKKIALITGGSSGIGLATARLFIAEGARVAITGRDQIKLEATAQELGSQVLAIQADTTDVQAMEAAVARTVETFGNLDIVFANAGIGGRTPLGHTELSIFEKVLKTNLTGVFITIQAALPHLNDGASIIFTGSVISINGAPGYAAYAASKGGLKAMSRVLASELSPRGIRVKIVIPSGVDSSIWSASYPTPEAFAALKNQVASTAALGRFGKAEEVAYAVLFLASDEASNIQAAEIVIDGGATGAPSGAPIYRK